MPSDVLPMAGAARRLLFVACRVLIGAVLAYSSLHKIRQPYDFLCNVSDYRIVGPLSGLAVAALMPWFELVIGICLCLGLFVRGALLGASLLTLLFVLVQVWALALGLEISCGCFSSFSNALIGPATLGRAVLMLGVAVFLMAVALRPGRYTSGPTLPRSPLAEAA
jgi:uncharacterized membrane protein YphA (DoxX/SURF4 family)